MAVGDGLGGGARRKPLFSGAILQLRKIAAAGGADAVGIGTGRRHANVLQDFNDETNVFGTATDYDAEGAGLQYFHDVLLFSQL